MYDMASFQIVPCHIEGMLALSCLKRKLFPRLASNVREVLHPHSLGL